MPLDPSFADLESFVGKHPLIVQQTADFRVDVQKKREAADPVLDDVRANYARQRPKSLEFNLKSVFQKAQAFKAAVDLASEEVKKVNIFARK